MVSRHFLNRTHCPVCGQTDATTLFELPYSDKRLYDFLTHFYRGKADTQALIEAKYRLSKCRNCELLYQPEILGDAGMTALYGEWVDTDYSLHKKQTARARLFKQYASQIEILSRLFPHPPHTVAVLEFGMGWGYWSRMAQAFGYRVQGLEFSRRRAAYARSMGIEVLDSLPSARAYYHFIYANQVFEHLPTPLETLELLRDRLLPDGIIYLRVPDGRGVEARLAREGWSAELGAIHPLEHINCFTRTTLLKLAANAGLTPVRIPVHLNINNLWGSIKREFMDRYITTHIFFKRR